MKCFQALRLLLLTTLLLVPPAWAGLGQSEVASLGGDAPVTVFYPSAGPEQTVQRWGIDLQLALEAAPVRGNGRLVVVSHGSGSAPWVHADLARTLVKAGFVVAMPTHAGDNYRSNSAPGPISWALRPAEVSRAIDAVGRDPRFSPLLDLGKVGVYGFSAGGHTVLNLAGGRWAPTGLRDHCSAHLEDDFNTCAGLNTRLTGGLLDGLKKWVVRWANVHSYDDSTVQAHTDPRIAAAVAAAPLAADFDMASFAQPRVPLALISLGQDRWLVPRFHSDRVLAACPPCVHLAHLPTAGHGAMRSPVPPGLTGLRAELVRDPPGFDRSVLSEVDRKVVTFMAEHLLSPSQTPLRGAESQ